MRASREEWRPRGASRDVVALDDGAGCRVASGRSSDGLEPGAAPAPQTRAAWARSVVAQVTATVEEAVGTPG
jgi:hypothetical protein